MIQSTMAFIVAMTVLFIIAVQTGTFDMLKSWQAAPQTTNINVNVDMPGMTDSGQPQVIMVRPEMGTPTSSPYYVESVATVTPKITAELKPTATRRPFSGVPFLNDPTDGVITPNEFFNEFGWGPTPVSGDCNVLPPLICPTPTP